MGRSSSLEARALALCQEAVVITDAVRVVTHWNDAATRLFGWTAEEMVGRPSALWQPEFPDDWNGKAEDVRKDGRRILLEARRQTVRDATGAVLGFVIVAHELTEQKRTARALLSYNRILELAASGASLRSSLEEVVLLVEEQLPGSLCSILLLDPATNLLRFGAGPHLPAAYNQAVDGVPVGPKAGSCGTAAHRKQPVQVSDIARDPLWEDYSALALGHGLRSCASLPILASGNVPGVPRGAVIGTFAVYRREVWEMSPAESAQITEAAHLVGVVIEREQAERAVRESEERLRNILDSSPAAMYLKDLEGRHLFANRKMAELFGAGQAAWVGKTSSELLPAGLAEACEQAERRCREGSEQVHDQLTWRGGSQRELTFLATYFPLLRAGVPYAVCGILTDVSETLSVQQELYRLWAHAPEPMCVAGFDGYLKQLNPAWSRCLGWPEAELLSRPWRDFVHPDDLAATNAAHQRLAEGDAIQRFVNRFRCVDGSFRWFSWDVIPLPADGKAYGFARDVTQEKLLSDQFRQAQKMEGVGQLASGVAHDFNNLLTVINGYCELLLDRMPQGDPQRSSLHQVRRAGQRAAELTAQLLAFSRKAIIEPKVLDLNRVVESAVMMLGRLIGEDVRLETRLAPIPPVLVDPGQIELVFVNLAVNARDAMPLGGRLTISTEPVTLGRPELTASAELEPGSYVKVTVTDTGAGMTPEVQARIFEPFFTTKGVGKGTGLGLATVYGIVRQAGGSIAVESTVGHGTRFTILIPAQWKEPAASESTGAPHSARGSETILLVEDEEGVRELARISLEMNGYRVLEASSGAEALRLASKHTSPIHLLVTDVVMPELGGRALADQIRVQRPRIPVLFISGYTDDAILRHGIEASRDHLLQKPFTPTILARRVRELLDR